LFVKVDIAFLVGLSAIESFWSEASSESVVTIYSFSFVLGCLLVLTALGVVLEYGITIIKVDVDQGDAKASIKRLKFELKLTRYFYAVQVFGHIALLGLLHGYLLRV
jgi:hypothetical protein